MAFSPQFIAHLRPVPHLFFQIRRCACRDLNAKCMSPKPAPRAASSWVTDSVCGAPPYRPDTQERRTVGRETGMSLRAAMVALLTAVLFSAHPAKADADLDDLVNKLKAQDFSEITVSRTLLGRIRVTASGNGQSREIVINPSTGAILRDYTARETIRQGRDGEHSGPHFGTPVDDRPSPASDDRPASPPSAEGREARSTPSRDRPEPPSASDDRPEPPSQGGRPARPERSEGSDGSEALDR